MVDIIPSFFTRLDFWVLLLPGYSSLIVGLFLLYPQIFFDAFTGTNEPSLFLVVVFIVGGPALGLIIGQLYNQVTSVGFEIFGHADMKYQCLFEIR